MPWSHQVVVSPRVVCVPNLVCAGTATSLAVALGEVGLITRIAEADGWYVAACGVKKAMEDYLSTLAFDGDSSNDDDGDDAAKVSKARKSGECFRTCAMYQATWVCDLQQWRVCRCGVLSVRCEL